MISVGAVDDVTAQGDLARVLERFRGDPRAALGLDATTDAAAARRAFMALCKVYHPAKFARYAPPTVRLANEVFLAIRRAYESVAAAAAAAATGAAAAATTGAGAAAGPPSGPSAMGSGVRPPVRGPSPPGTGQSGPMPRLRATPPIGVPVTPSTTGSIPAVRDGRVATPPGDVPVTRPASATTVDPAPAARRPPGAPPGSRSTTGPVTRPATPSTTGPIPVTRPAAPSTTGPIPVTRPGPSTTGPVPVTRPAAPSTTGSIPVLRPGARPAAPSTTGSIPVLRGAARARVATPPGGVPVPPARPVAAGASATVKPAPPVDPAAQFEAALELARREQWAQARAAFAVLATAHPGDARYRAHLHYARGWEAHQAGKPGEARAEWQRALACDPGNALVRWALESTGMNR